MMERVFHYVVIRYRPLPELSEFANVGIMVYEPELGLISYKLAPARFKRITQFFDNVEPGAYADTIRYLEHELSQISVLSSMRRSDTARHLFFSFASKREGVIAFSALRSLIGRENDRGDDIVGRLYDRFIRRNLDQMPQREVGMVREIRQQLQRAGFKSFKARQIDDEIMPVRLPLVSYSRGLCVIKPIAFEQKTTLGVMDHANLWKDRFAYLIDRGRLERENIHISVERPDVDSDDRMAEAFLLAKDQISSLDVEVSEYEKIEDVYLDGAILDFAARRVGSEGRLARW